MKFNWKKIIVSGTVAGMVIVTGCAGNVPSNNHGNRNGERLTNAVTRNVDGERNPITRGINTGTRAVRNVGRTGTRAMQNATRNLDGYNYGGVRSTATPAPRNATTHRATRAVQPGTVTRHHANQVAPGRNHAGRVHRTTADFRDGMNMTRGRTHNRSTTGYHGQPATLENGALDGQSAIHNTLYIDGQQTVSGTAVTQRSNPAGNASTLRNTGNTNVTPNKIVPNHGQSTTRAKTTNPTRSATTQPRTATQHRSTTTTRSTAQPRATATAQPRAAATQHSTRQPSLNSITLVGKNQQVAPRNNQRMTRGMTRGINRTGAASSINSRTTRHNQNMTRSVNRTAANNTINRTANNSHPARITRSASNNIEQRNQRPAGTRNANRAVRRTSAPRRVDRTRTRVENRGNRSSLVRQSINQRQSDSASGVTRNLQPTNAMSGVNHIGAFK